MKRRAGRVSRSVAKKYNKNRVVTKIKSPPPSTSNESTLKRLNKETRDDQSIVSNEICMNNNDTAVDHVGGINLILEDIENQEPGPYEIAYQGDELMDIDAFLESWSMDSNGLLSLHNEEQIEKIFADLSVECDRKNDKEDEILSLSASHSLGFCSYKDPKEIGFDDDMMLWMWEDDNLELHHRY
nr:homeodomain-like protein [Tanacetum cinerariifolium]